MRRCFFTETFFPNSQTVERGQINFMWKTKESGLIKIIHFSRSKLSELVPIKFGYSRRQRLNILFVKCKIVDKGRLEAWTRTKRPEVAFKRERYSIIQGRRVVSGKGITSWELFNLNPGNLGYTTQRATEADNFRPSTFSEEWCVNKKSLQCYFTVISKRAFM